jgi:hypothetical protein
MDQRDVKGFFFRPFLFYQTDLPPLDLPHPVTAGR